jgi:hypothetical protein
VYQSQSWTHNEHFLRTQANFTVFPYGTSLMGHPVQFECNARSRKVNSVPLWTQRRNTGALDKGYVNGFTPRPPHHRGNSHPQPLKNSPGRLHSLSEHFVGNLLIIELRSFGCSVRCVFIILTKLPRLHNLFIINTNLVDTCVCFCKDK